MFLNHLYRCVLPWIQPAFGANCQPISQLCSGCCWAEVTELQSPSGPVRYHMKLYRCHTGVWGRSVTGYYHCNLWYYWCCGRCWLNSNSLPLLMCVYHCHVDAMHVWFQWFYSRRLYHLCCFYCYIVTHITEVESRCWAETLQTTRRNESTGLNIFKH